VSYKGSREGSFEERRQRLLQQTAQAWRGHALASEVLAGREEGNFHTGDLLLLPGLGNWPLEWAVIAAEADRRLLVAADIDPMQGSADVGVPAAAPAGPLSLRCRFAAWCPLGSLAGARLTGTLEPEVVEMAVARWRAIAAGTLVGPPSAREVDAAPRYRAWTARLGEALAALSGAMEAAAAPASISPAHVSQADVSPADVSPAEAGGGKVLPFTTRVRFRQPAWPWALAASLLLVAGLGLATTLRERGRALEQSAAELRAKEGELAALRAERGSDRERAEAERRRWQAEVAEELSRLRQEQAGREAELAGQIRRLEKELREGMATPLANLAMAYLRPLEPTRGEAQTLTPRSAATHMVLVLSLPPGEAPGATYRLELLGQGESRVRWRQEGLYSDSEMGEIAVVLPRALLGGGEIRLRLSVEDPASKRPPTEYRLRLEEP